MEIVTSECQKSASRKTFQKKRENNRTSVLQTVIVARASFAQAGWEIFSSMC
jgi:hypothetical protein